MRWISNTSRTGAKKAGQKPTVVAFCSARAVGKSTLVNTLVEIYGPGFSALDCSALCDEHIEHQTPVGLRLLEQKNDRDNGGLYEDADVVQATHEKIGWERNWHARKIKTEMIAALIAGIPRKLVQYTALRGLGYPVYLVRIVGTLRQVFEGVHRRELDDRAAGKPVRKDGTIMAVVNSWNTYQENDKVLVDAISSNHICTIHKSMPLGDKVDRLLEFAPLLVRENAIRAFASHRHPVRKKIREIEERVSKPVTLRPEVESFLQTYEQKEREVRKIIAHEEQLRARVYTATHSRSSVEHARA